MEERQSSAKFDIALKIKLDLGSGEGLKGTWKGVSASGSDIIVRSVDNTQVGKAVTIEMPVPVQMQVIRCKGEVSECHYINDAYEIAVHITEIDEQPKESLLSFCDFLTPSGSETLDYLIREGEKALTEAAEVTIKESMGTRLEALMHELLSVKYHDALRSFEDALKIDGENETAVEGFCYSLAKAVYHYEHAGLDGIADIIRVKAMPYSTDDTIGIAERSPRMDEYSLKTIRSIFS